MTEPNYVYTKGIGWHTCVEERKYLLQTKNGKVWAIDRKPKKGERGIGYQTYERDWFDGIGLIPDGLIRFLKTQDMKLWTPEEYDWKPPNDNSKVATIILYEEA